MVGRVDDSEAADQILAMGNEALGQSEVGYSSVVF